MIWLFFCLRVTIERYKNVAEFSQWEGTDQLSKFHGDLVDFGCLTSFNLEKNILQVNFNSGLMNDLFWWKLPFPIFRRRVFTAFTEELLAAPFTDQIFHFIIPALADTQTAFPYEPYLSALSSLRSRCPQTGGGAPWLFFFVLTVGDNYLGTGHEICLSWPHAHAVVADEAPEGSQGQVCAVKVASGVGVSWKSVLAKGPWPRQCPWGAFPGTWERDWFNGSMWLSV